MAKQEKKSGKGFFQSIKFQLLAMAVGPLLVLAVIACVFATIKLESGLDDGAFDTLQSLAYATRASYETLNNEDFHLSDAGELYKGDYNITENVADIDAFTEGLASDVTLFFGDTRRATSLTDKTTGERIVGTQASAEIASIVLGGQEYQSESAVINGESYFAYYVPLRNPDGKIVGMVFAGEPSEEVNAFIKSSGTSIILIDVIILLIAAAIVVLVSSKIAKAVAAAGAAVAAVASGDMTYQVNEVVLKRNDEIGDMGKALASCIESLHKIASNIQLAADEVLASGDGLEEMASQSSQTADEISNAVTEISRGAVSQAEEIETAAGKITEMGQTIEEIAGNVAELKDTSGHMQESGNQAQDIVKELAASNDKTVHAVLEVAKNVEATDESVKKISEAVELITNVATQTNLLSLNASIEAARAGEAGKGFAVVATEIQKLSEESNGSAQKISEIIRGLAEDSRNSLAMMEEVKTRLKEQQDKLNETKAKVTDVAGGIVTSREGTEAINEQALSCDAARGTIVDIISNLSAISQENAASTEETTASMQELNATINMVAESSAKLKDLAVALGEETKFFKL